MGRTDRSKEGTRRNPNEGTSARTRPASFEEIMSRRKKQQNLNSIEKDSKMKEYFGNANDTQGHTSSVDCHQIRRISKDSVKERSKKEESTSRREMDRMERKYIGTRDLEMGVKVKSIRDKSSRGKESYNEKHTHHAKTAILPAAESEKANGKRLKDYEEKDKYDEQDRKPKRDWKRKSSGHYEHKIRSEIDASKSKKHDSVKPRDTKYSGRDGSKNYHLEPFYEDPRLKRRRSRSREYDHERERSASLSPLSRRRVYNGRDHGDFYKDNSRKKQSDGDRYRTSGHVGYSSGHYRKHGSGLGGYSPRKRKTEAAIEIPSPTNRSPERKTATWDQLPSGPSSIRAGSIFTAFSLTSSKVAEAASSVTVIPATTKAHPTTLIDSVSVVMNASVESVQLTQATRPMRRLYIENLPPSTSEKSVIDCLNDYLLSSGAASLIQRAKPCISCIINKDKCQALVEFLTPEDATAALSFAGNTFSGTVLKMRRPKDFTEAASGVPEQIGDVVKTVSDVVNDSPYKIFVGGISDIMSSKMIMEIASAFGPLKAFRFDFNKELNGSCVFLEYEDHSITSRVCAGLNGLILGGCILTAVRAFPYANGEVDDASPPSYAVPPHAKPLLANVTQVLRLQNVVNPEEISLLSENELEETMEDVRLECARFGTVKSVHLVRHSSSIELKSDSVNASTVIESAVEFHSESLEKVGELSLEEVREASPSKNVKELENVEKDEAEIKEDGHSEELQGIEEGNDATSESPLAGDADLDHIAADKGDGRGSGDLNLAGEADLGYQQAHVCDAFEPGSVFVEFQRKEAALNAAHCLHGRCYGERTVAVEYIPHDFYLKRFLK